MCISYSKTLSGEPHHLLAAGSLLSFAAGEGFKSSLANLFTSFCQSSASRSSSVNTRLSSAS